MTPEQIAYFDQASAWATVFQRLMSNLPEQMRGLGLPMAIWIISIGSLYYAIRMRTFEA